MQCNYWINASRMNLGTVSWRHNKLYLVNDHLEKVKIFYQDE